MPLSSFRLLTEGSDSFISMDEVNSFPFPIPVVIVNLLN